MIKKDTVVSIHYTLSDDSGQTIDSSRNGNGQPLTFLHGHGNLIPGVERALEGRQVGDRLNAVVAPEEGYGLRDENAIQRVSKKYFRDADHLRPGMTTVIKTEHGHHQVTVMKVGSSVVDIDGNHPLAGKTLHFDLEVVAVREASAEELDHGHVHGPGGHHH